MEKAIIRVVKNNKRVVKTTKKQIKWNIVFFRTILYPKNQKWVDVFYRRSL